MITLNIPLETPAKKNNRITLKNGKTIPSKNYRQWHETAYFFVRSKQVKLNTNKCFIILIFTHGDLRRRDADNGTSSIFDLLQDCNVITDDKWEVIKSHHVFNNYSKSKPNCEIRIYTETEKELYLTDLIKLADILF